MFGWFEDDEPEPLDDLIESVMLEMSTTNAKSDEYPKLLSYLERLTRIKGKNTRERVSSDTMAIVFGNLVGIVILVAYEHAHPVASKAITQVIKPKLP